MPNRSFRKPSPSFPPQRDAKRPRLDATSSLHRAPSSPPTRMMSDGQSDPQHEAIPLLVDPPTHTTVTADNIVLQQWPTSSSALATDPNAPGSRGPYFEGGDYFPVTRTTSMPIPVAASKPPLLHSSSTLGTSSGSTPLLCPSPFNSVSPVASFSSDTSAATHHSSTTTSLDHSHDIVTPVLPQIAQRPGGDAGYGLQLNLDHSERTAEVAQSEGSSVHQPLERSTLSTDSEHSYAGLPRSVEEYIFSAPPPPLSRHGETPHPDTTMVQADTLSPTSIANTPPTTGSNSPPENHVDLSSPSKMSVSPSHERSSRHVESVGRPSQLTNRTNPFASTLARDALLSHAYRIYDDPASPLPSGLSPAPTGSPIINPSSPGHAYTTQLLPLLVALRTLHPYHLPTLLLFSCVLYAVGDFNGSLTLNSEILHIDPNYVRLLYTFVGGLYRGVLMQFPGRGHVQHWNNAKGHGKIPGGRSMVVESNSYSARLLGCHSEPFLSRW
jgi:hypothetical protein